ncbi:MAG: hypothetical protein RIQ41_374 [Candidatus Parcubacteria bacterium]|jgi:hypothetical protein
MIISMSVFSIKNLAVFLFSFVIFCSISPLAHGALYAPGQTLDPSCLPTDSNCGISTLVGSGIAGQVSYYASSGNILTATSSIFILSTGNVGIGTTTPSAKLSVAGSLLAEYLSTSSSTATTTIAGGLSAGGVNGLNMFTDGKISIGTSTPKDPFYFVTSVSSSVGAQNPIASFVNSASSTVCGLDDYCNEAHLGLISQRSAVSTTADAHRRYIKFGSEYQGGSRDFDWYMGANAQHRFIIYSGIDNVHFFKADANGDTYLNSGLGSTKVNINLNDGGTGGLAVYDGSSTAVFAVSGTGETSIGGGGVTANQGLTINEFSNSIRSKYSAGPTINLVRTDADATVTNNNLLGRINFKGVDSTEDSGGAIEAYADGTWLSNDTPGRLTLSTVPSGSDVLTERMRITSAGNIGVGTTTPGARLSITQSANTSAGGFMIAETGNTDFRSIFVDTSGVTSFYGGDTAGTLNTATLNAAGAWINASDRTYKENIVDVQYGLDTLLKMQPRRYDMKGTHLPQIGFIAQELKELVPEVVDGEEGRMGISYGNLVAVVVKAVQELSDKVSNLSNAISTVTLQAVKGNFSEKICVGATCLDESQLKAIIDASHNQEVVSSPQHSNDDVLSSESENGEGIGNTGETSEQDTASSTDERFENTQDPITIEQ